MTNPNIDPPQCRAPDCDCAPVNGQCPNVTRAGPPTPRAEPYRDTSHAANALTFGGDPEMHLARNAACREYMRTESLSMEHGREVNAFNAGWAARKRAEYGSMIKEVDKRPAPVATLFPTNAELDGTSK